MPDYPSNFMGPVRPTDTVGGVSAAQAGYISPSYGVSNQAAPMTDYFNDPRLAQASGNYQQAAGAAEESAQGDISLAGLLKDTLAKKFGENNPMIQQRQGALEGYLNSIPASQAAVLPENQGGTILSPVHQADLIAKMQNAKLAPLATANSLLGLQTSGISDVIESASAAHQASTRIKQQKADFAKGAYNDILNELSKKAELAFKNKNYDEGIRQFETKQQLEYAKLLLSAEGKNKLSASQKTKANVYEAGLKQLDKFEGNYKDFKGTGPIQGNLTNLLKNIAPGLIDKNLARLQSDIGPLRETIINAISGANVSAKEAQRVESWIPSNTKSPDENKRNLKSLRTWLQDNYETITNENYQSSTNSQQGTWEVVSP